MVEVLWMGKDETFEWERAMGLLGLGMVKQNNVLCMYVCLSISFDISSGLQASPVFII